MASFDVTITDDPGTRLTRTTVTGNAELGAGAGQCEAGPHDDQHPGSMSVLHGPLSPIFNSVTINGNGHTIDAATRASSWSASTSPP